MTKRIRLLPWLLSCVLILAQVIIAAFFTKIPAAGMGPLSDITYTAGTGKLLPASPLMSIYGLFCRLTGIGTMTFALRVLPFVVIPLCYLAYRFLICSLPEEKENAGWIFLGICVLQIFGYQSDVLLPCTLLLNWFGGTVLFVHLILPLALGALIRWRNSRPVREVETGYPSDEEDEDMKHKILNVRNLGIAFLLFAVLAVAAIFVLNRKINNLHDATASLQQSFDKRGEVVAFYGAHGDEIRGYILVGNDGGLSVIFGGDAADGPALMEVLSRYGSAVDAWYLKKGEEGICDYCVTEGITVEHVYTIQGLEEIK